ncbi:hypothetical protein SMD44_00896 [Streptomyces alboflavus]|uniref:LamG-like jellyroll fold domain-containing protein n=1 Tax=Streptomyces alboflavus TaxID=67267 RepID=A0A1Z1W4Z4_9ACTN|nr:LamG-like jellyroll fold domain-containing protein [Streptomyces alboflavus]ARX81498.1 hypothetical protein SMD44_00896 [Streptomyces alboflavus]
MAVRFDADAEDYTQALALGSQAAISASCWAKVSVDRNTFSTAVSLDNGTSDAVFLQTATDGVTMGVYEEPLGNFAGTGRAMTVGTWYWLAYSISGTSGTMYSRALSDTTVTTSALTGLQATHNIANLRLGESAWGTEWLNGAVCAVKIWTAALTQNELESEALLYRPQRIANLVGWYPLHRPETADYSGNGRTLSGGAGTAQEDGPGISWGPGRSRIRKYTALSPPPAFSGWGVPI